MRPRGWWLALWLWVVPWAAHGQDLNNDGRVDQTDLNALTQYLAGDVLWSTDQVNQADLNKDGQVDARDLALLQQRLGIRPLTAKAKSFEVGIAQVVPEWVRGNWTFTSQVLETGGLSRMGSPPQDEEISLPGDLSANYFVTNLGTGERLQRICWQVDNYSDQQFSFTERNQDRRGNIFNSSVEVSNQGFGRAEIRIRTTILAVGSIQGGSSGGLLNNIFGVIFGGGGGNSSPQRGAYYVRGGRMNREPGSERVRLPEVDLARLRCR